VTKAGREGLGMRLGASGIITVYEVVINAVTRGEGPVTQTQILGLAEVLKPCYCKCKNAN